MGECWKAKGALRRLDRKILSRVFDILFAAFIIYALWYTILSRTATVKRCDFRLFWALRSWLHEEPQGKKEFIRYLQNILFFIPFGFLNPWKKRGWKTVAVSAAMFSVFIEVTQYVTARGMCEVDDMNSNTLGAAIGYALFRYLNCWIISRKESMSRMRKQGIYEKYIKRLIDIICALSAIIVFSWLYIVVAILVRVKLGSPVLFTQPRPGKDEKIFKMYKFRSMTDARDESGNLLPDDVRMTKFGRALRATSMDELPEALNILKGDRGIIGTTKKCVDFSRVVTV